jgi:excisionase family DNA binding protein
MEELMDVREVARRLKVKESTIRAWVFQRRIPVIRLGSLVRFREADLDKWIRDQVERVGR